MFRKRSERDNPYGVGVQAVPPDAVPPERLLDLLAAATEPVDGAPLGILDERRDKALEFAAFVRLDADEFAAEYDLSRDYQFDHPISHVDRALDMAFVPAGLSPAAIESVAPLIEGLILRRVARYVTRAAARARMAAEPRLVDAAMRAYALANRTRDKDARDDMVSLAPVHVAAGELGKGRADLTLLAEISPVEQRPFVEGFASRTDVTLAAFGWMELQRPHGVWIVPDR